MHSRQSISPHGLLTTVVASVLLIPATGFSADHPRPTPRPGTLGAYARTVTLDRSLLDDSATRVILTNENVADISENATITLGAVVTVGHDVSKATGGGNSADRARWRAAHRKQEKVIADLERQLSLIEIKIDDLERQQLTPRVLARLDRAEAERRHVEQEISRARNELSRIVRDARRHGAEPGWFR